MSFLAACASGKQAAREQILLNPELDFWKEVAPAVFKTRIQTTQGDFVIEAHRDWAPIGVDRFHNLVRAGFFDDSRFYRI
ncbi:peptidylprolyl isomerase, partial [candidate division KSB1 bacterium]|nr:peptidylprolyl isomerase [candidate division KSB1 bacterium]